MPIDACMGTDAVKTPGGTRPPCRVAAGAGFERVEVSFYKLHDEHEKDLTKRTERRYCDS